MLFKLDHSDENFDYLIESADDMGGECSMEDLLNSPLYDHQEGDYLVFKNVAYYNSLN